MPRVKRGRFHIKKRKRLLAKTKGYKWGRKKLIKQAKEAVVKAGAHAYIDRRKKKRTNRGLQQIKISAFVKEQGLSYSKFMGLLKKKSIILDRKILADLAENNKEVLTKIVAEVQK
ncbi:MAG: 50S ribosomal protein L20 [Candidatus Falkowbacteria bacterium]|nr:50S ribosomal protein L20 [Candidatus Falkowbacteria bacterium]